MKILVQKFGGSSVADLECIRRVARKIVEVRQAGYDLVVVVSAMGDTTDELLGMAKELSGSPSRRELDMLLSVGERISMALLSMAVQDHGYEAVSLTGSQCGIITTHSHSNARIMDVRPFRVQDELEQGRVVIVAGYQGTSYRRDVTTLGRGGSDTTAVALAAALGAEACEIYSDVDGVFSADPRVILTAKQLKELSHEEMLEMARSGAKVLNEQAVEFARLSKIALYARSAHKPDSKGTIIRRDSFDELAQRCEIGMPATAVSHIGKGLWIKARESSERVLHAIESTDNVFMNWTPGQCVEIYLNLENIHDAEQLITALKALGDDITVEYAGLVSVVGQGIGGQPRWVRLGQQLLESIEIYPIGVYNSLMRLSWVIPTNGVAEAANALHDIFVDEQLH